MLCSVKDNVMLAVLWYPITKKKSIQQFLFEECITQTILNDSGMLEANCR